MQSYDYHLEIIKTNINSLSKLKFTLLDHFFKRKTSTTSELKQFSCHLCSTGCSSDKALKRHYKEQHQITFTKNDPSTESSEVAIVPKKPKKLTKKQQQQQDLLLLDIYKQILIIMSLQNMVLCLKV